ncbi:MAG: efflux RND transporter periplasmic adaptor subunit [Anaerovorax sp.]|nr:efflux RND transporter periplasmic adaptor subunit [Anaerovorax sp.]
MKQSKKKKKWILLSGGMIAVIIITVIAISSQGVLVDTAMVETGSVIKLIKESGTMESESAIIVTAQNTAEIQELLVSEGDAVNIGDTLMKRKETSADFDIKSLQSELSGLQAQYNQAKDLAIKNKILYDEGALSYEEYNQSDTTVKKLSAQIDALNYSIQSRMKGAELSGITAPIDGVVTAVFVKEGETVTPGSQLFEISNLNDTYVKVDLIAEDAAFVKAGDSVRVFNEDAKFSDDKAAIKKVHLKAQEKLSDLGVKQKRVTVEISVSPNASVRLGSNVDVEIVVDQKKDVLRISDMALFEMDYKDCVYVIKDGKAELREVKIGLEGEDFTEIVSGLSEGETVILSPNEEIQQGSRVKIEE